VPASQPNERLRGPQREWRPETAGKSEDGVGSEADLRSSQRRTTPCQQDSPRVQIEAQIEQLLLDGLEAGEKPDGLELLSQLGRLGAQLVFQRAMRRGERFLPAPVFERTPQARGSRNGHRPKQVQTAEDRSRSPCPRSATA